MISATLRDRILDGTCAGDALRKVEVAEIRRCSRHSREALKVLTLTGLTVHEVHHGVSVRRLTPDKVDTLYGLRTIHGERGCDRAGRASDRSSRAHHIARPPRSALQRGDVLAIAAAIVSSTVRSWIRCHRA